MVRFRAQHLGIRRAVELKIPPAGDEEAAARLSREAQLAGRVAHRNVQSVVDSGTLESGEPFVVLEQLDGPTIAELVARSPAGVPEQRAAGIVVQLLDALAAVHRAGLVHRGIRPDAIRVVPLRGGDELVKLGGFENAVLLSQKPRSPSLIAPLPRGYTAPEILRGDSVDVRSDLYAAGMILQTLLQGHA